MIEQADLDRLAQRAEAAAYARLARLQRAGFRVARVVTGNDGCAASGSGGSSSGTSDQEDAEEAIAVCEVIPLDFSYDDVPGCQSINPRERTGEPILAGVPAGKSVAEGDLVVIDRMGNGQWWIIDGGAAAATTTTTTRPPACDDHCQWSWDGAVWVLDENPCPESCPCPSPASALTGSTGATTQTYCGVSDPEGDCETAPTGTTTTLAPCTGGCTWYSNGNGGWSLDGTQSNCVEHGFAYELQSCCGCSPPARASNPCEQAVTDCYQAAGANCGPPGTSSCEGGTCAAYWSADLGAWITQQCGKGCYCESPGETPAANNPCPSPTGSGSCRDNNGCYGGCDWSWDGSAWTLDGSECEGDCGCSPPPGSGTATTQVARTCCRPPTTTTTTTLPPTECCNRFRENPVLDICAGERITLTESSPGVWNYNGLLACGEQIAARVDCDSTQAACDAFTVTINFPCASPQIFTGTIVECKCDDVPYTPPLSFIWEPAVAVDLAGCSCCESLAPPHEFSDNCPNLMASLTATATIDCSGTSSCTTTTTTLHWDGTKWIGPSPIISSSPTIAEIAWSGNPADEIQMRYEGGLFFSMQTITTNCSPPTAQSTTTFVNDFCCTEDALATVTLTGNPL